jgi:hypothetical protein
MHVMRTLCEMVDCARRCTLDIVCGSFVWGMIVQGADAAMVEVTKHGIRKLCETKNCARKCPWAFMR